MKSVLIKPGCISCGSCAFIAPEIFDLAATAFVRPDAPISDPALREKILRAAQACPVAVIWIKE
jgi:ferredoxin